MALKAHNSPDYEELVNEFRPIAAHLYEAQLDGRRIASAKLAINHSLGMQLKPSTHLFPREIRWVELMEARPEDQSEDPVQFDHMEFHFPNGTIPIRAALRRRKIPFLEQENQSHAWLSVIINERADELKFNDQTLESLIAQELES